MEVLPELECNYVVPPEYHVLRREERALLIDPVNHIWFATDEFGVASINAYARDRSFADATRAVATRAGLSEDDPSAAAYVSQFFAGLADLGFLHRKSYTRRELPIEPSPYPVVMYLHLTAACNLKCSYCYNQDHRFNFLQDRKSEAAPKRQAALSTTEKFIKIIEDAAAFGLQEVKLTGGEATLYRDFLVIAKRAKQLGLYVNLLTNGAMISEDNADEVVRYVDSVSISLDSSTPEGGHDAIRGAGSHAKAMQAVALLRAAGLERVHLNGVVTPSTLEGVEDILDFAWNTMKAERVSLAGSVINVRDTQQRWGAKQHVLSEEEFAQLENRQYDYHYSRGLAAAPAFRNQCGVGNGVVSVDPNGDVYPCQTLHEKEFLVGNAFSSDIKSVLDHSPDRDRTRRATVDKIEECNVCPVRYICGSGCRSEAYTREGDFLARNKDMCPTFFAIAEKKLWNSVGLQA
ncbi:radical SAM protein with 4Fe4S-binding SPASM domain [Sphingomonas sp. SORGH_AS802]|uniref:radical SAM/SPASM domain-containing protein n=1 Tax=unclassified Sphingomonas TaxID=196159 RepID=UPI002858BFFC|nr:MULTISPECIES: radical SAM protein [unclassified Sphingomonas]MDR6128756.1 radical SAM protein with 4Fe4S-binding SPASM domain [Sphingomonas sp. SORGH_AS_0438]MDR6136230.1 radical SAM protein with 4Fe4S-binding SPASM domain [Sphingomonas sp. SORGH_AS_0802]